ncbi:LegC family aminotransferase [Prochlorococcus sp. MIT 1306]|uniref:LegC family aminotransferase n=1 Tax=Prochlorococcus sp. MIT 1306 TaxID=1799667 RepID=UPI0007B3F530|nr:LegC family aminotransferase [Prochlorococcus sp. MIT 1306]KZR61084.1 putative pyridoxal phosphate-dependent aminotransferase EpsN [Prochlorococcus sp. MIT 1306]
MNLELLDAIEEVCCYSSASCPIALHEPDFGETNALAYVKDCIDHGWVSSAGQWVTRFEEELCNQTGASHAIAVCNGTVALRLALHLLDVKANDEVIMPSLTFVATANAASHLGAIPHFVDIDQDTLGLSPLALERQLQNIAIRKDNQTINRITGRRITCVVPVHVFGNPALIEDICAVANEWNLPVVEDAAEALGSWYKNIHCGMYGKMGVLSFNGNKLITTGGGGAVITNDSDIARQAKHISTTAKVPHSWEFFHDQIGWNDRMPNINAALGVAQLENLKELIKVKYNLANKYRKSFSNIKNIQFIESTRHGKSNNWLISVRFTDTNREEACRQKVNLLEVSHQKGILLRPAWQPLHKLPMYKNVPKGELFVTEDQSDRLICLPSSPQILRKDSYE